MPRTGMIARGLRAVRRMAMGAVSEVYVLAKATGTDTLEEIGSTSAAVQSRAESDGTLTLRVAEDAALTEALLARAAAFALASESDGTLTIYRRIADAQPPLGDADRTWTFNVAPTGVAYIVGNFLALVNGTDLLLLANGSDRLELAG